MQKMSSKDEQLLRASALFDGQCHQRSQDDFQLLASDEVRTHLKHWALIGSALRNELPAKIDPDFSSKVMASIEATDQAQSAAYSSALPALLASKSAFKAGLAAYAKAHDTESKLGESESEQAVGAYDKVQVGAYRPRNVGAYEQDLAVGAYDQEQAVGAYQVTSVGPYEFKTNLAYNQPFGDNLNRPQRKAGLLSLKRVGVFVSQIAIAASVAIVAVVGLQTYNASDLSSEHPATTTYTTNSAIGGLSLASFQTGDADVISQFNTQMTKPQVGSGNDAYQAEVKQQQEEEIERINLYIRGYVFDTAANK